jgi:signal peptidase I
VTTIDFIDAREIVLSAKLGGDSRYGLFVYRLESDEFEQLPTDPNFDYVYPTYLPGDRIPVKDGKLVLNQSVAPTN